VANAGIVDLLQPAEARRSREWGHDEMGRLLDGRLGQGGDVHRLRRVGRPKLANDLQALFKDCLVILKTDSEWRTCPTVIATACGEIDATAREHSWN